MLLILWDLGNAICRATCVVSFFFQMIGGVGVLDGRFSGDLASRGPVSFYSNIKKLTKLVAGSSENIAHS